MWEIEKEKWKKEQKEEGLTGFVKELSDPAKKEEEKMKGGGKRKKERVIGLVNKLRDERKKEERKGNSWVKYFHSLCDFVIQLSEPENERIILISVWQHDFTQQNTK